MYEILWNLGTVEGRRPEDGDLGSFIVNPRQGRIQRKRGWGCFGGAAIEGISKQLYGVLRAGR